MELTGSEQHLKGWAFSLAFHLLVVAVAVTAMPKMTLVVEQEPFKWDVVLVERVQEVTSPDVPTPTVRPLKPVQSQVTRLVEPTPEMIMPRVAPQQSAQMIHPLIETPTRLVEPIQPVQEIVQVQPKPAEREEVKEPEPVREVAPVIEPVAPTHTYQAAAPAASHHHVDHHSEAVAVASAPAVSAPEPEATQHVSSSVATAPAAVFSEPVVAAPPPRAHQDPPVVASAPAPRPATKADYAWLAESLGRRIAALTRYPSSARLNGWEGRVVLRAVIRADGHLLEVTVHRSSGHDTLDRAALETIKLACPLHMKQALNTAQVAVYVPIVYSLAG